jgi:hypothetical protein
LTHACTVRWRHLRLLEPLPYNVYSSSMVVPIAIRHSLLSSPPRRSLPGVLHFPGFPSTSRQTAAPSAPPSRPAPAHRGGRWNLSRRRRQRRGRRRRGPPRRAPKATPGAAVAAIRSVAWPPTPTGKSGRSPGRGSSPTRQARSGEGGGSQVMRKQVRQMPVNELVCHSNMFTRGG